MPSFSNLLPALFLSLLTGFLPAQSPSASHPPSHGCASLSAMTFNLRYASPQDGENVWNKRRDEVAQLIRYYRPAVLGTQEGLQSQLVDLDTRLPNYQRIGVGRGDGKKAGEYAAIYYDSSRLSVLTTATFWLSETQDTASVGWDAAMERIATYGLFYDRTEARHFWVFNAHFDHLGLQARTQSAHLLLDKLAALNTAKLPVILLGDFNSEPETVAIRLLAAQLDDALGRSQLPLYGPRGTFTGFDPAVLPDRRIDYIFTQGFHVGRYRHIADKRQDGFFISDHLPVLAELFY